MSPRSLSRSVNVTFLIFLAQPEIHHRAKRNQRYAEVRRMGRDTRITPTEHGMEAVFAVRRVAA
jgi:hypothetical protein